MSRRKGIMSDSLKYEIAQELGLFQQPSAGTGSLNYETAGELGVYGKAQPIDWGSVSSRDCGNMVKMAIQMAERNYGSR
ncbi:MAG: small, acid-soluble spore protein, alpha/beta type [Peptococcaceae bacterium]|nr:small, acid-soluble spore protein, alpha/beta type [Peptococcaceae bacterium]